MTHTSMPQTDAQANTDLLAQASRTGRLTAVIGPKTRLGAEVLAQAKARGDATVVIARGEVDEAVLADIGHDVRRPAGVAAALAAGTRDPRHTNPAMHLVICALGPVHTWQTAIDREVVARELGAIDEILAATTGTTRVTYVSSVVALAPGADRRSYAGWKLLIEHRLREITARHGAQLSVVYPGRLVEPADVQKPWHRLHTLYSRLAAHLEQLGRKGPSSKVIGLDARLWLLLRGLSVTAASVTGNGGSAPTTKSEGPAAPNQEFRS
ncbi:hypothetical protein BJ980_002668 [Nocardioides daedukensis]|uniref:SDR family NAD(P)-dependent oxidoreductase n=1 Tax=Nocardioides daedukensis TaxID=634462 RepID=A0A7Y9UVZ3_9ACTN|nr:hypothetical protein [Nocardioides daedukensis]NYG59745.1 hypothetical protein [Nocardioides daedukensis]